MTTTKQMYGVSTRPGGVVKWISAGGPTDAAHKWVSGHPVLSKEAQVRVHVQCHAGREYTVAVTKRVVTTWSAKRVDQSRHERAISAAVRGR